MAGKYLDISGLAYFWSKIKAWVQNYAKITTVENNSTITIGNTSLTPVLKDGDKVLSDNNFTDDLKSKLEGIESGAEVNVQSDWNQTNTSADDYIKNKPNIGSLKTDNTTAQTPSASESFTGDINLHKISKTGSYNDLNDKPTIPSSGDFVTSLGTNGNNVTWTKNGTTNNITVPYATNANTATKLGTSTIGSTNKPIFLNSGTPTEITSIPGSLIKGSGINSMVNSSSGVGINPAINGAGMNLAKGGSVVLVIDDFKFKMSDTNPNYLDILFDGINSTYFLLFYPLSAIDVDYHTYSSSNTYSIGDIVIYKNTEDKVRWYRSKMNSNTGNSPTHETDNTYWEYVSGTGNVNYALGMNPQKFSSASLLITLSNSSLANSESGLSIYWRTVGQHPKYLTVEKYSDSTFETLVGACCTQQDMTGETVTSVYCGNVNGSYGKYFKLIFEGWGNSTSYFACAPTQIAFTGLIGGIEGTVVMRKGGSVSTMFGDFYPNDDVSINLGTSSKRWNNVYANKFIKKDGTSSQFLKADGSVDSNTYATTTFVNNATSGFANDVDVVHKANAETITGEKTFNAGVVVSAESQLKFETAQDEGVYIEANDNSGDKVLTLGNIEDDSPVRLENIADPILGTDAANRNYANNPVLIEKTFDPYTISAEDTANGYLFFLNVVPISDNYYMPWKVKYKLFITTTESYTQGEYDCEIGSAGTASNYSFFNRFYSTSYYPSYNHLMAFYNSAAKYANRETNPIKIGERINSARSATTLARVFKIQVYEAINCEVSFPEDIEKYGDVYTDAKYGYCSTYNATTIGLQESSDNNFPNYYNYEYYTSYHIHGTDTPLYRYKLCGFDIQGRLVPITSTNQTSSTIVLKTPNTVPMDVSKGIIFYYSTKVISDINTSVNDGTIYRSISSINLPIPFNFNTTNIDNCNVYLVGDYNKNTGMFTLDNSGTNSYYLYALKTDTEIEYFAQFTEGKYYWLLGNINTSSFDFLIDNPIFYYDGIRIISINTQINKADKVSNATSGNFAGLDSNGNLVDSGYSSSEFAYIDTSQSSTLSPVNLETTSNKKSTISGYETSEQYYPNTKAVADALGKWGVMSQTQTWSGTGTQPRTYVMSDLVYGTIPQANIDLYVAAGATFNTTTGYFELNGLTDISYEEMSAIYAAPHYTLSPDLPNRFAGLKARTIIPYVMDKNINAGTYTASLANIMCISSRLETFVNVIKTDGTIADSQRVQTLYYAFNSNYYIRSIRKLIFHNTFSNISSAFAKCYSLEEIELSALNISISFSDSSLLNLASIVYMVQNAANTSAITITLHADALARCTNDTTEYTYNGNTYTGIVALATAKNITLAS